MRNSFRTLIRLGKEKRKFYPSIRNIPGPGAYNQATAIGGGPKISLSPRCESQKITTKVPGPGAYSPKAEVLLTKKPAAGIGYGSKIVIGGKPLIIPGPGAYIIEDINKSSPKYGFGTSQRVGDNKLKNFPGPGNYDISSTVAALPSYEKFKIK